MKIKLGTGVDIDLDKLIETRLLVQANSGGGKSWAIRRLVEQSFGKKQIIILDPEGEFGNLRSEFDFVYAGKGGDAPVDSRSAALLAHRLLELKASTIVDLYELQPQERKHFVRLFCEAMVNSPKNLWHDVLVIIDEAHVFAPEKGESEAMGPVIDLATRGRKRGYCVVLATQRLPKLNKDAAAECNNKLIGRASQDIDRKRAAEELGFTSKEQVLSLRDLDPGEFYAFGPAISRDVIRVVIGDVKVKPPKRGVSKGSVPAPSATVKKMLGKLADLPQEAEKQARTVAELKKENASLKAENTRLAKVRGPSADPDPGAIKRLTDKAYSLGVSAAEHNFKKEQDSWKRFKDSLYKRLAPILADIREEATVGVIKELFTVPPQKLEMDRQPYRPQPARDDAPIGSAKFGKGEKMVLAAIASYEEGMTREHITVQTGYKRSTRDAYIQRLVQNGYAQITEDGIRATQEGVIALGSDYKPLPTGRELVEHHLRTLPQGESTILRLLVEEGKTMSRDEITEHTNYQRSTRDAYIQRLGARQLVVLSSNGVMASPFLL